MKYAFFSALTLIATTLYADAPNTTDWTVTKESPPLSYTAVFNVKRGTEPCCKVVRNGLFTPRYDYDLYDSNNTLLVHGRTRLFSLGMVFAWGSQIDLYDENSWIGMIHGEIWTTSRAKFSFYNSFGELTASAYLDDKSTDFLFISAQNPGQAFAQLKGKAYGDSALWEMSFLEQPLNIDERALQIFASFAADFQKNFVRPPKQVHHYYFFNNQYNSQ